MRIEDIPHDHPDFERVVGKLNRAECPDCDQRGFDAGPRGGLSQNIFCRSCGAGFNVAPAPTPRVTNILFVQRISPRKA